MDSNTGRGERETPREASSLSAEIVDLPNYEGEADQKLPQDADGEDGGHDCSSGAKPRANTALHGAAMDTEDLGDAGDAVVPRFSPW